MINQSAGIISSMCYCYTVYMCYTYSFLIAAFYYTLGNIRPEYRSHLNSIQLLRLISSKHLYGVDAILEVLMKDLLQLEQAKCKDLRSIWHAMLC